MLKRGKQPNVEIAETRLMAEHRLSQAPPSSTLKSVKCAAAEGATKEKLAVASNAMDAFYRRK